MVSLANSQTLDTGKNVPKSTPEADIEANQPPESKIKNKGAYHPDDLKDLPPDGGVEAWTAAACSLLYCFASWGSVSSYAVFLNFYLTSDILPGITKIDYALVAGLTMCLLLCCSFVVSGLLVIWNVKVVATIGLVLHFVGMLLASFSVNYWQMILTEGILSGLGCGILFAIAVILVPSWFLKRRTIASGLQFAGTGLGGCVFSLVSQAMIERTGNQRWALRTIAFIALFLNVIATALVKLRKPLHIKAVKDNNQGQFKTFIRAMRVPLQPKVWFTSTALMLVGYFCISSIGYVIILYSLSNFAVSVGLSAKQGSDALAILNACQFIGRLSIGIIGDKIGRFNISMLMSYTVIIFTFAFWIPITTYAQVIAFSAMMGLVMGYQFVTISPIIADFFGVKNFPVVWCLISFVNSIVGLVSELIALGLKRSDSAEKPYLYAQIFTGVMFAVSSFFLLPLRELKISNIIRQWKNEAEEELVNTANTNFSDDKDKTELDNGKDLQFRIEDHRINQYNDLLATTPSAYLKRVFYPIAA